MLLSTAKVSSQTRFLMPYMASQRSPDDAFATFPTLRVLSFRICGSGRFTSRFFVSRLWWSNLDLALRKKPDVDFRDLGVGTSHGARRIFGRTAEISGGIRRPMSDRSPKSHPRATCRGALGAKIQPPSAPAGPQNLNTPQVATRPLAPYLWEILGHLPFTMGTY